MLAIKPLKWSGCFVNMSFGEINENCCQRRSPLTREARGQLCMDYLKVLQATQPDRLATDVGEVVRKQVSAG